jgi:asparagine synthase (glutamine-hydrolysing)
MEATVARDIPGMADVDFSLLLLCKHIRKKVKVALSGECADEIFGGYPWFRDPNIRATEGFPWSKNLHQRIALLPAKLAESNDPIAYVDAKYRSTLDSCDILPGTSPEEKRMKEMMVLNIRWFMQTLLDRKDRMSMYNSLEVRVPFCDHRIAEYLYGVPWEYKNYNGREKGLLRYAISDHLPDAVLFRKKSPYPKTFDPQYMQIMLGRLNDIISRPNSHLSYLISHKRINELLESTEEYPWYGQLMRAPQIIAYFLQLDYWLQHYNVDILI